MSRPRVAWWSPVPPNTSGIADYSAELLPHLARRWEIDVFAEGEGADRGEIDGVRVVDAAVASPAKLAAYDAVVYHIGNGPVHAHAYRMLLARPGLVVLHDVALTHLVASLTHGRGRTDRLFAEMRWQHGDDAAERLRRHLHIDEPAPWSVDPLRDPLNRRALEAATGILVHSRFAASLVRAARPGLAVEVVAQHAPPPPQPVAAPIASPDGCLTLCTAGHLTPAKRIEVVLGALARIRDRVRFRYRLVGAFAPRYGVFGTIRDLGLWDQVECYGRVSQADLYRYVAESDLCVNLRHPTSGETSAMVQRVLACGRPVVVSDIGWFAELPDECAAKVPADDTEVEVLARTIEGLASDAPRRLAMGQAALRYAASLDAESRAEAFDRWVRSSLGRSGPRAGGRLEAELVAEAESLGVPLRDLRGIARDLTEAP